MSKKDVSQSPQGVLSACHAEMDYRDVEGQFGQTFATSIPCQLRFTEEIDGDAEQFHEALDDHGYVALDTDPARRSTYDGEVAAKDHYNRMDVLVFRGSFVRLFPLDDYVPNEDELGELLAALEEGFGAELEHAPIDRGDESE